MTTGWNTYLRMKHGQGFGFVQRYKNLSQKASVLALQRECKAVDNAAQNLQQFTHTVELFCFVDEPVGLSDCQSKNVPEEDIIDLFTNKRS